MAMTPSRLLLLPSLLLMGWGVAAWLEEGTAWTSTDEAGQAMSDENVDVRILIGNQAIDDSSSAHESYRTREPGQIRLVNGEAVVESSEAVPAWLTGEIEPDGR